MSIRVIISDENEDHAECVKASILLGYGSDISEQITIIPTWQGAVASAQNNPDIIALIRCTGGVQNCINDAKNLYPRVQTFFPLGGTQNVFADGNVFTDQDTPVIVTCGAGDDELRNNTSFGNGLEFWDGDLINENLPQNGTQRNDDASSDSTGIILGNLLKIKDTLNCIWWEARYRARMTSDRNEPNRLTIIWDYHNGYGKPNVTAAIAFVGLIPPDPYVISFSYFVNTPQQFTVKPHEENTGEEITYVVPAGTVTSLLSEADANDIALKVAKAMAITQLDLLTSKNIIGFYSNVNTRFGPGKAMCLKEWAIKPGKTTNALMNVYADPSDIINAKAELLTIGNAVHSDVSLLNAIYRFIKSHVTAFKYLNFIYEGDNFEEAGMGASVKVNSNYSCNSSDGLVEVIGGTGVVVITLLKPCEMLVERITIMNLGTAQVKVICEDPTVLINDQEFLMITNRYDGYNLKPDTDNFLILP